QGRTETLPTQPSRGRRAGKGFVGARAVVAPLAGGIRVARTREVHARQGVAERAQIGVVRGTLQAGLRFGDRLEQDAEQQNRPSGWTHDASPRVALRPVRDGGCRGAPRRVNPKAGRRGPPALPAAGALFRIPTSRSGAAST